jgi:uncharacterized repeat protein (TIGR01451 family)
VSIRVNDSAGAASNEAALTVAVANVAPTVALTGASTAGDGETKTYAFTVTDPGSDSSAVAPGYPRCGANGTLVPGSLQSTSSGGTFQCKFAAAGATASSVVAIKVTDSDGAASAEATIPVAVASAPAPPDTRADVALTKIESADPLPVGSALTYTLTVTNNGPATAENVRVVDPMPSGLTATSVSTTLGTCSGSTAVTCSLGSLEKSARATVQIAVQPAAVGSLVNTAAVTSTSPDNVATNNTATVETTVGPPGTVAVPVVPDTGPPHDVSRLRLRRGTTWLRLSWGLPTDKDLAGVVVTRTTSGSAKKLTLFRGRALGFTDRRVRAGARYSYRVRTYDTAGNTSRGVVAAGSPLQLPLFAPPPNARVASPPLLRWRPVKRASYYNVQLFRNGQKLLSAWPRTPMLRLQSRWRFARHAFALSPGTYRWYVWPGYGERSLSHYGGLLGQSAFTVTRAA